MDNSKHTEVMQYDENEVRQVPKDASLVSDLGIWVDSGPIYKDREYKKQFGREWEMMT